MIDGWSGSERFLSIYHKIARYLCFNLSNALIAVGSAGKDLFNSYTKGKVPSYICHLCVDNDFFLKKSISFQNRKYDYCLIGLDDRKNTIFALEAISKISTRRLKGVVIGHGSMEFILKNKAIQYELDIDFTGYLNREEIASYLGNSKIFLFPTKLDAWGLVVNEALASGCVVISSPYCGAANDLIVNNETGFIVPLSIDLWCNKVINVISWGSNLYLDNINKKLRLYELDDSVDVLESAIVNAYINK